MMVDVANRRSPRWLAYQGVAMVAFVLVSLVLIKPLPEVGFAVAGTALILATRAIHPWSSRAARRTRNTALVAAGLLMAAAVALYPVWPVIAGITAILSPLGILVGWLILRGGLEERGPRILAAGVLLLMMATIGFIRIAVLEAPVIDVYDLHIAAADAILDGDNPWTQASVPDTSPTAEEGAMWVGYPYPPLTLIPYAAAQSLLGDPRWATVIAMAVTLVLIVRPWVTMTRLQGGALVALGLALVSQPVLSQIVRTAWTDAIALPFLMGVGLLWRRNPMLSAVLLGLAFGTKQYFIVALPFLLFWGDEYRWKRLGIAGGVAALSVLPAFLLDWQGAWDALVAALLETPLRLDSIGFAGIGWETPMWLMLVLSAATAVWMGLGRGPASRFLIGIAAVLSVAFLFTSQSFLNYWFFIAAAIMVAIASDSPTNGDVSDIPEAVPESLVVEAGS